MIVTIKNNAGNREKLTCDCGSEEFELYMSDDDGNAFECEHCGEISKQFTEYQTA